MKIAVVARGVSEKAGGAKEYIISLLNHLPELAEVQGHELTYYFDAAASAKDFQGLATKTTVIPSLPLFIFGKKFMWDHFQLPLQILKDQPDVVFFPKNMTSFWCPKPTVVTIHDMMYFLPGLNAYTWHESAYHKFMMPWSLRHASKIISVSENTLEDICSLVDQNLSDKASVIHEASIERPSEEIDVRKTYDLGDEKYIFFSGSLTPRKNLLRTVKALALTQDKIPHKFVMTGSKQWLDTGVDEEIKRLNLQSRFVKLGYVPTEHMNLLFREADIYIHPTLYEGFGLTVLEAFAQSCPVISSNTSSIPEVVGDAALTVNPYSIGDISSAIIKLATDLELRKSLVEKGHQRLKLFSWEKAASETLKVITSAVT